MKSFRSLALGLLLTSAALAQDAFPGLDAILTPEEKKRAGLSRLSPDELGVIDAALIRYYMRVVTGLPGKPPPPEAAPTSAPQREPGFWDRFGVTKLADGDWKNLAPMTAKVTGWQGGNRFALDNGQVWEGLEPIPFELPGKSVIIEARPLGNFALKLDAKSAAVRVKRVK
ncbi:MAG: hypothetical protein HZA93_19890 [Verrucomicrobia bacterium]|nr:hypothetical protein [Verrucomicrobiota bacterium]